MMEKFTVYIETTIVSYLTARRSNLLTISAQQQFTETWWDSANTFYDLYTSEATIVEAGRGDMEAAKKRLVELNRLPLLRITDQCEQLAKELTLAAHLPRQAELDA